MKFELYGKVSILLTLFTLLASAQVYAGERKWIFYSSNIHGKGYYSPETIQCLSDGILQVWTKNYSNKKHRNVSIKSLGVKYSKLSYALIKVSIDCKNDRSAILNVSTYATNGELIDSEAFDVPTWRTITPETTNEALKKAVCGACRQ